MAGLMRRKRLLLFCGITAPYLISYFQRSAPAVVGLEIAADMGLNPASLGFLASTYAWGYAAAQLPAGVLADTWGPRNTISLFVLIAAAGGALFAAAPNLFLLSLGRFLVGLGVGFVYVPGVRLMIDWYEPDELGTYSGALLGIGSLGALASATPLVFAVQAIGWRGSFMAVAVFTVLAALFCRLAVRDKPEDPGRPKTPGPQSSPPPPITFGEALGAVFSNRRFFLLGAMLFCFYGAVLSVGSLWAGPYLRHVYGLSQQEAGNVIMAAALGLGLGCPLAGYVSDKILKSRKKVLLGGAALHLLAYLPLIGMAGELSTAQLHLIFLWFGISGGAFVLGYACAKETVASRYGGTALGSVNIFLFLGGAVFQAVMGMIIARHAPGADGAYSVEAYRAALAAAAAALAAASALFLFFREKPAPE